MFNSKNKDGLSIIIPTRNEENIVIKNLTIIHSYVKNIPTIKNFELLICDYSEDNTEKLVLTFIRNYIEIKYFNVKTRGIGAGLKTGIKNACYQKIIFYPIDLAYDIHSIKNMSRKIDEGYDIVFGSRRHSKAFEKKPLNRRILSDIYSFLIKYILNIKIKDTQGVFALKTSKINYFKKLESDDGFFQTELALFGDIYNSKIIELPVNQIEPDNRQTKTNQFILGYYMMKKLIKISFKIRKNKI